MPAGSDCDDTNRSNEGQPRTSIDDATEVDASLRASPYDLFTKPPNELAEALTTASTGSNSFRVLSRTSVWRRSWKTVAGIVGFYIIALLCAIAHHSVFVYLNGRVVNLSSEKLQFDTTTVSQMYATTTSLALVTAFRAALVASVGLCYTQYLWKKLRTDLLEVGLIEELFQIRANALRLLHPALIRYTPVLFSVAILSWLLPVAMIYPPGALIVGIEYRPVADVFNVSVIPADDASLPFKMIKSREIHDVGLGSIQIRGDKNKPGASYLLDCSASSLVKCDYFEDGGKSSLNFVARAVLSSSRILDFERPSRENVSYSMSFQGPMLQCDQGNTTDIRPLSSTVFEPRGMGSIKVDIKLPTYVMSRGLGTILVADTPSENDMVFTPCPQLPVPGVNGSYPALGATFANISMIRWLAVKTCVAATAKYDLNVSYINGVQHVAYSTGEKQVLHLNREDLGRQNLRPMQSVQAYTNLLALVDSLDSNFDLKGANLETIWLHSSTTKPSRIYRLRNGTEMEGCAVEWRKESNLTGSAILMMSAFNKNRKDRAGYGHQQDFVNATDIDITEELLNQALANITISALSLNTWYGLVNGSSNRAFNVYYFDHRLSFYLPYGLCLLFTLPVIVIGLLALKYNGVSAIDGGFVQILMTTTGRTELEDAAVKGCLGGEENIPKELKKLKIRFGERITDVRMDTEGLRSAGDGSDEVPTSSRYSDRVDENSSPGIRPTTRNSQSGEEVTGDDQVDIDTSLASGAVTHQIGNGLVRRAGFGIFSETDTLRKGVQYGRTRTETEA